MYELYELNTNGLRIRRTTCLFDGIKELGCGFHIPEKILCFGVFGAGAKAMPSSWISAEAVNTRNKICSILRRWEEIEAKYIEKGYNLVRSCNQDNSMYLLPPDSGELSYEGHPEGTIRISDHWSWYSSEKKCPDLSFIQCNLHGITPRDRIAYNTPTTPKTVVCIAKYHNGVYYPISDLVM